MTLEIRETTAGNFPFGKEENSRQIRKKQPFFLNIVMVRVYHRRFGVPESNCKFMCYAIPFLFPVCKPGRVVQSVGRLTRKSEVLGSIPGLATYFRFSYR